MQHNLQSIRIKTITSITEIAGGNMETVVQTLADYHDSRINAFMDSPETDMSELIDISTKNCLSGSIEEGTGETIYGYTISTTITYTINPS